MYCNTYVTIKHVHPGWTTYNEIKTTIKYSNATLDERPLCKYCN